MEKIYWRLDSVKMTEPSSVYAYGIVLGSCDVLVPFKAGVIPINRADGAGLHSI